MNIPSCSYFSKMNGSQEYEVEHILPYDNHVYQYIRRKQNTDYPEVLR